MYKVRKDEPKYAFIPDVEHPERNRYGKPVQLVDENDPLAGKSLNINGDSGIGDNPNRYKQHGFYFNADNCIACHACEAACAEKNNTPPHLAFRSVGYLEGGSYPAVQRLNISMACNHCDNPVCLKGCPTRAYTKFAEYGAVLQDPDICFGCGYCTWVCPYNAPQLDTEAGHVSKCNMCIDRLEVGLKPACAAACLGGALDFGIIETTPEGRSQLETRIPGFPDPSITHPNIRFQQMRSLPREMRRVDSVPLRYVRDDQNARPDPGVKSGHHTGYRPAPLPVSESDTGWNLKALRSREDPLVLFTLITQGVVGAFLMLFLGPLFGLEMLSPAAHPVAYPVTLFGLIALQTFGLVISTLHLGRPHRFYRAFNNLRYSPVSREVAAVALFYNLLGAHALFSVLPQVTELVPAGVAGGLATASGWLAVIAGPLALWFMHRIYRIPARPYWNHWQVLSSFYGSMLVLGPLFAGLVFVPVAAAAGEPSGTLLRGLALPMLAGILLTAFGAWRHVLHLRAIGGEGEAALGVLRTRFRRVDLLRWGLTGAAAVALAAVALSGQGGIGTALLWALGGVLVLAAELLGRALFYVLVIPTTLPGAFFWRNPGFQAHAREAGLAEMPQVGVQVAHH
ncbi:DmsC/YnfH family molybdoenzyme membrane anchor subunit [Thiohalobacter sp.]|uniref:DmsC/YnfH family molybdoenzyme membrane anchor subunit n=1 Tax=Thiohalobacter sp. TaxID=2025948 RepID=UPI00262FAC0F|nr:DmsC/YnfH family molybdoenzyme membrane anchor subunit [Thiohalobacter sp.]